MTAPLLSKCNLIDTTKSSLTLIKEDADADGSFLISSILGHRIKIPNMGIVLVCSHQNFNHYLNAGQRLGYSLKQGSNLKIIDLCEGIEQYLESASFCENLIAKLWKQIELDVAELKVNSKIEKISIIIDDLIFFKAFGFTDHHLIKLIDLLDTVNSAATTLSLIIKVNNFHTNEILCNHIEDQANVVLVVEKLKSGSFKDIDGQIKVRVNDENTFLDNYNNKNINDGKKFLYKINERNVKVYMPGELGVKI